MLRFRRKGPDGEVEHRVATVWMRYVDGQWRVYEVDAQGELIQLDDPKFLEGFVSGSGGRPAANEASAVGSLRTLNVALVTYASTYPDIGYAGTIEALAGEGGSPYHAGLIDEVLGSGEKSGYRFRYERLANDEYRITARPVEVGVTGVSSFYTDQSGVIRRTSEDRESTVEDPPLQ